MKFVEFKDDTKLEPTTIMIDAYSIVAVERHNGRSCRVYMNSGVNFWVKGTLLEVMTRINK